MAKLTLGAIFLGIAHIFTGTHATQNAVQTQTIATSTISASNNIDTLAISLSARAQNLNPQVAKLGLIAYSKAHAQGLDPQQLLTIVDYSKPSTETRMWVFDLKTQQLLFQNLVAHGKGSGDNIPTSFSDAFSSHKSSIGLFVTEKPYIGHHGYSLKLAGLEKGFNDMAAAREIVVHAANYVSEQFAAAHGRLGRSWGCFAVNPKVATPIINTIKNGTLLFAYYPDQDWLSRSRYLSL
jgi:hypothetical protein